MQPPNRDQPGALLPDPERPANASGGETIPSRPAYPPALREDSVHSPGPPSPPPNAPTPAPPQRQPARPLGQPPPRYPSAPPPAPPGALQRRVAPPQYYPPGQLARRRDRRSQDGKIQQRLRRFAPTCLLLLLPGCLLLVGMAAYLLFPMRTNLLVFGLDYTVPWEATARSDTIMLVTFNPFKPFLRILAIPRDLWVTIPGQGENRINTAHFIAETQLPGSGPQALIKTISHNFGVTPDYYLRFRFESFRDMIDALGGIDIVLEEPAGGYPAGRHHLTGQKALAFVRDRTSGGSDFARMEQGQMMIRAILRNLLNPLKWPRLPATARVFFQAVDTNIPVWVWPRLGVALLRRGPSGIESYVIDQTMVQPFVTDQGAMVLAPEWTLIRLLVHQIFDQ